MQPVPPPPWQSTGALLCDVCYREPAAEVVLRSQTGLLLWQRHEDREGTWCHACGMAKARRVFAHNVRAGWWSPIALFTNWYVLFGNHMSTRELRALPEPSAPPTNRTLDPGRPVFLRFGVVMPILLVAGALVAGAILRERATPDEIEAGMCLDLPARLPAQDVVLQDCGDPHDAEVITVLDQSDHLDLLREAIGVAPDGEVPASAMFGTDPAIQARLAEVVTQRCARLAASRLGTGADRLAISYLESTIGMEASDVGLTNEIFCVAVAPDGRKLERSYSR